MQRTIVFILLCISLPGMAQSNADRPYIIPKDNGRIILAHKAFDDFLNTDKSWQQFEQLLFTAYPEVVIPYQKQIQWGGIDTTTFRDQVTQYRREDFAEYISLYSASELQQLYDSVIVRANAVLPLVMDYPVDLCVFLPFSGCFIEPGEERSIIYISAKISPRDVYKIMAHEYGHFMHMQRRPEEPLTLMREVVSEGMAVYLTMQILPDMPLANAIPFMSPESVQWCMEHEQVIADSINLELYNSDDSIFRRYIGDGSYARPPKGFVQKTAYYTGYRVIEACINKGMTLEDICALDAQAVLDNSGYFR